MTIPITGQPPVPSLSEPDTFNTKALNLFTWQTGSMLDQFNNVDPNDFFDIPALTAAAAQSQNTNAIINGAFDVWQRGTTFTDNEYGADRWVNRVTGGTVVQSKQTFPVGTKLGINTPGYFLRQSVSGQAGTSQLAATEHRVEDVSTFAGETITIPGWAKRAAGSGGMTIEVIQVFGTGGSANNNCGSVSVALTGSWEPFAATFTVPSISGKTVGTNSYLLIRFWTSSGSSSTRKAIHSVFKPSTLIFGASTSCKEPTALRLAIITLRRVWWMNCQGVIGIVTPWSQKEHPLTPELVWFFQVALRFPICL